MPPASIAPIPTRYMGYHFRSRLEARWAVFFQEVGANWEYEPEGFDIGGELYLPDFRVKLSDGTIFWYEVKPCSDSDTDKFQAFSKLLPDAIEGSGPPYARAILLTGDPFSFFESRIQSGHMCPRCGESVEVEVADSEASCYCFSCDHETPSGAGNQAETGFANTQYTPCKGYLVFSPGDYLWFHSRVEAACMSARSARFEHGECGAT